MGPFFALAADVDAVFDCDDAMDPTKRQMGFGRVFRAWREWRIQVDPDFDPNARVRARNERLLAQKTRNREKKPPR